MKQGARLEAVIEVIERILTSNSPADYILRQNLSQRRYAGSSDRRYIGDMVFQVLRNYFRLVEKCKVLEKRVTPRLLTILSYYEQNGLDHTISSLTEGTYGLKLKNNETDMISQLDATKIREEKFAIKNFLFDEVERSLENEYENVFYSLSKNPNVDVRVNTFRITRNKAVSELRKLGLEVIETPVSPVGIRFYKRLNFFNLNMFKEGLLEVQDEGSQIVSRLLGAEQGMNIVDICAGGGGKTLAMWSDMNEIGSITASDISIKRLERIKPRIKRAGIKGIKIVSSMDEIDNLFDLVLLDVPCSGSGAWRRRPEEGIRLSLTKLKNYRKLQKSILQKGSKLVEKGGVLAYVTCSFIKSENEDQITSFLKENNRFELLDGYYYWDKRISSIKPKRSEKYFNLRPHDYETDGFFLARLKRTK